MFVVKKLKIASVYYINDDGKTEGENLFLETLAIVVAFTVTVLATYYCYFLCKNSKQEVRQNSSKSVRQDESTVMRNTVFVFAALQILIR